MDSESPHAVAMRFLDAINRGDIESLAALMHEEYQLRVFDEPPQRGRKNGIAGWRGYASAFPEYRIFPQETALRGDTAAILGHTTGSHLGLPDDEERILTLIWLATIREGLVVRWDLIEDTADNRRAWGLGKD